MSDPNEPEQITGTDARSGAELGVMRYVLGISLALVILVMVFIVWRPFG